MAEVWLCYYFPGLGFSWLKVVLIIIVQLEIIIQIPEIIVVIIVVIT